MIENLEDNLALLRDSEAAMSKFILKSRRYPASHKFFKVCLEDARNNVRQNLLRLVKINGENISIKEANEILKKFIQTNNPKYKSVQLKERLHVIIQEMEVELEIHQKASEATERIYDRGIRFDFHLDVKRIINKATNELFIVDSWINEDLLEIYLKNVKEGLNLRILTNSNNPKGAFIKVAKMFQLQYRGNLEAREIESCHDRGIFVDNKEGWVIGQSIKDAAKNKPTYLVKLEESKRLQSVYDSIWNNAKKII